MLAGWPRGGARLAREGPARRASGAVSGADADGERVALLRALVRIPSVNPSLVPGAAGEGELAAFVADWGRERGIEAQWLEPRPGRPSVVLRVPGTGGGRSLMLNAHLDTVGVQGMEAPFAARVERGRLYGRGALDMKASVAACLRALERVRPLALRGDVLVAAVADEEHGSLGTEAVLASYRPDAAVVTEPSGLELQLAHRGFAVFEIVTTGLASHTSQPERGVNAVAHMGRVLAEVERLQGRLAAAPPHPLAGRGGVQAVRIDGGEQLFVMPAGCRLTLERRSVPGERAQDLEREVAELVRRAGEGADGFAAEARLTLLREPFEVAAGEPIVEAASAALESELGEPARVTGAPYWTDAALYANRGVPTVIVGPAGAGLHAADEHVELLSVARLERTLISLAAAFCA